MKKMLVWAVICMMLVGMCAASASEGGELAVPTLETKTWPVPDNESLAFVRGIRLGWNLGNTFDAWGQHVTPANEMSTETMWVNIKTTKEMIDEVRAAGFNALRLPVSWHNHVDADFNISAKWLDRVQEVVDYAYNEGMYVIINIHHDCEKGFYYPSPDQYETSERYVKAIWSQVSARFADYGEKLIFENINEPRLKGTQYEWWVDYNNAECRESIGCINRLNQAFVDTVRASGGNNANRYLMVTPYDASYSNAVNSAFFIPKDSAENKLIVSVHAYLPYLYALAGSDVQNSTIYFYLDRMTSTSEIDSMMDKLYNRYIKNGVPVILGEFGSRDKNGNTQSRVDHAAYYVASATARGIPCFWWDNNFFGYNGEAFGLFDRAKLTWRYPEILQAMLQYTPE